MRVFLFYYNLLFPLVLLALLPGAILRMARRGNYAHKFGQRFGSYSRNTKAELLDKRGKWIWVHAVSVGEVLIALKFIRELQQDRDIPVLLSTTTSTGFALANEARTKSLEVIYHPVDFLFTVRRILDLIRPRALVLVEAEIWPNLTFEAKRLGAKVIVINARLSVRSEARYRFIRVLAAQLFSLPDRICLQDPADLARFQGIGAKKDNLLVTGSIKFDPAMNTPVDPSECWKQLQAIDVLPGRRILLGASTHPGEEAMLARVSRKLQETRPDVFLILVPRHAERGPRLARELQEMGFRVRKRSEEDPTECDLLLIDSTGELRNWTETASVVFIGKSLTTGGGQNPAEAIAAGKPLVFGPKMHNFRALVHLISGVNGACEVQDETGLSQTLAVLLDDPAAAVAMAARAKSVLDPHEGATKRSVGCLMNLLEEKHAEERGSHP